MYNILVLGKLIIGIIIGPALLGWIEKSEMITQLSEIKIAILPLLLRSVALSYRLQVDTWLDSEWE